MGWNLVCKTVSSFIKPTSSNLYSKSTEILPLKSCEKKVIT